jgi:hypothetical protein
MPDDVTALSARYGISTTESFFDLDARRHLMPSVMDPVPTLAQRCACPGGKGVQVIECIRPFTGTDHLCDACRQHCHGDKDGTLVSFLDYFGPAYHWADQQVIEDPDAAEREPMRHRRRELVRLSDHVVIDVTDGTQATLTRPRG